MNILHTKYSAEEFASKNGMEEDVFLEKVQSWKSILMEVRNERVRPGLDDKVLTSWNGLLLSGLCKAYQVFAEEEHLSLALGLADFTEGSMRDGERLFHSYQKGQAHLQGYLEDYACVAQGYLSLYQISFEERWLQRSRELCQYAIDHFYDAKEGMFFFTDNTGEALIARKKEVFDSVIPSSNAIMLYNLHYLAVLLDWREAKELAHAMLLQVLPMIQTEPQYLTYWASMVLEASEPAIECCIVGEKSRELTNQISRSLFSPNAIFAGTSSSSALPLLQNREAINGEDTIYVCRERSCQLPVHTVEEALQQVRQ